MMKTTTRIAHCTRLAAVALLSLAGPCLTLFAAGPRKLPQRWEVRAGGGVMAPQGSSKQTVIGGDIGFSTSPMGEVSAAFFVLPRLSVQAAVATSRHTVTLSGADREDLHFYPVKGDIPYGKVTVAPLSLGLRWHFTPASCTLRPYAGVDASYTLFGQVDPGTHITGVSYKNVPGIALKAGAAYTLANGLFAYLEARQGVEDRSNLVVDLSSYLLNYRLPAQVSRCPFSISAGIGFRF